MTSVWVITLNGRVQAVAADVESARTVLASERGRLSRKGAKAWRPIGGDPKTALSWASHDVTSLHAEPFPVLVMEMA